MTPLQCFKAYDVRGRIPDELNPDVARRIGLAYAAVVKPRAVVLGHDIRLSSRELCDALASGLLDSGVDVLDIGQCGTEEIYFATFDQGVDGGIVVTASHNPKDYNGMKFVREGSRPISSDSGLLEIRRLAEENRFTPAPVRGSRRPVESRARYVQHLLGYVDRAALERLRIVVNAGNGGAGAVVDALAPQLPFDFVRIHHEADGNFPNGVPNPLLEENREPTRAAVLAHGADMGVAWDGDFDRCFLFDEKGNFIEGYYIVGLLAEAFLRSHPGERIVHDPRLTWNTVDIVSGMGGIPVQTKTGHAFIKERMRAENAIYGGEMSAHHYFRDFAYCDSGMIPWLLVAGLISASGKPLSELIRAREAAFPCSGEINSHVADPQALLAEVERRYARAALGVERVDGLSLSFADWRFNLRLSNTEPVVRLNVETRADRRLMEAKRDELLALIRETSTAS
ncbi:MAG: phosphomannomutase [Gammaproteobacteria bacterium]